MLKHFADPVSMLLRLSELRKRNNHIAKKQLMDHNGTVSKLILQIYTELIPENYHPIFVKMVFCGW